MIDIHWCKQATWKYSWVWGQAVATSSWESKVVAAGQRWFSWSDGVALLQLRRALLCEKGESWHWFQFFLFSLLNVAGKHHRPWHEAVLMPYIWKNGERKVRLLFFRGMDAIFKFPNQENKTRHSRRHWISTSCSILWLTHWMRDDLPHFCGSSDRTGWGAEALSDRNKLTVQTAEVLRAVVLMYRSKTIYAFDWEI